MTKDETIFFFYRCDVVHKQRLNVYAYIDYKLNLIFMFSFNNMLLNSRDKINLFFSFKLLDSFVVVVIAE